MKKGREFDHSKYALWIDPNEVIPYERNAKIHDERQIANIANSIRRFGWQQDTVITRDKVCVIGHGRRLAAIQLGCEMPYHIIDKDADEITDDEIRQLRLADNLINSETGYDYSIGSEELAGLSLDGFDFDISAFATKSIKDLGLENEKGSIFDSELIVCPKCGYEFEKNGDDNGQSV